jgi:hypothetical protein
VLSWDFSDIDPDPPPLDDRLAAMTRLERIGNEVHRYLNTSLETFLSDYRDHLPEAVRLGGDAFRNLDRLLAVLRRTSYGLYLMVDEYDNFANEVMTAHTDVYEKLVKTEGPFKRLFKWVKKSMGSQGIERLFITGVTPVVMSDVTGGLNIADSVFLYPELADLCGFTGAEIRGLLEDLHAEMSTGDGASWTVADAGDMMREWYDGYRFAVEAEEPIYNPTLALYFMKHLQRTGAYPRQMLDANLAADEGKLDFIGRAASGRDAVMKVIRDDEPLEIEQLADRFTLRAVLERSGQDESFLGSYLYYFGMLTLAGETDRRTLLLSPPNQVIRKLFVERILRFFLAPPSSKAQTSCRDARTSVSSIW